MKVWIKCTSKWESVCCRIEEVGRRKKRGNRQDVSLTEPLILIYRLQSSPSFSFNVFAFMSVTLCVCVCIHVWACVEEVVHYSASFQYPYPTFCTRKTAPDKSVPRKQKLFWSFFFFCSSVQVHQTKIKQDCHFLSAHTYVLCSHSEKCFQLYLLVKRLSSGSAGRFSVPSTC